MASDTAMAGETCKLCLKYVQGDELTSLDEDLLGKLEFLQLDLEQSVEESNSLCTDCEDKINNASNFKSCILNNENSDPSEPQEINGDIPSTSTGETSAEKATCHMCKLTVDKISVISLFKLLKDESVMEVLQGHIPEVSLTDSDKSMVCEVCQKSLASFSMLVQLWLTANDWNEDTKDDAEDFDFTKVKKEDNDVDFSDNTNSSSAFEVSNSASSSTASTSKKGKGKRLQASSAAGSSSSTSKKIKTEIDEVSDSSNSASLASVKKEETEENENADDLDELQLKSEEIDIKNEDEEGLSTGCSRHGVAQRAKKYYEDSTKRKNLLVFHSSSDKANMSKPYDFDFITKTPGCKDSSSDRQQQIIEQRVQKLNSNQVKMYKCEICCYETKYRPNLQMHTLKHKSLDEVQTFKCNECTYITKYKSTFNLHVLLHRNSDEVVMYKCEKCPYETKFKRYLMKHSLKHKNLEEVQLYKCKECSYQTKYKSYLKEHEIKHIKFDDIQLYKCQQCSFETRYKHYLRKHQIMHLDIKDVRFYQCDKCPHVTIYKHNLKSHMLKHKSLDEVETFKCQECSYITKRKDLLKSHSRKHHNADMPANRLGLY